MIWSRIARWRSSLAGCIIVRLIVFQFVVILALMIGIKFYQAVPGEYYMHAQVHVENLLAEARQTNPDGQPFIAETPALERFRSERPEVRIAIVLGPNHVVEGSDPALAAGLRAYGFPKFWDAAFAFPDDFEGPLAGTIVVATSGEGPWSDSTLFVAGNSLRAADLPDFIYRLLKQTALRVLPVFAVIVLVVPFIVHRAFGPLLAAGRAASAIDLGSQDLRLPEGRGVPSELEPLVRGINVGLDRLDEALSAQQRFAAQAAHEMRTPLAILAARIDGLDDRQEAEALRRNVERMRTLVDRLLFVARLKRRDLPLDQSLDLVALARDVVADCAPLAIAKDRRLVLLPEVAQLAVRGNALVIEGALANLIENAVRSEPVGGAVEIIVRAPAEVLVVDHGVGIPSNYRERVFEPFWRRDERHPGAGLGLTIVREAAMVHGGSIRVEETPGGGATFRFSLGRGCCESREAADVRLLPGRPPRPDRAEVARSVNRPLEQVDGA